MYEIVMQIYSKFMKQYEKEQKTIKYFDKLNRKSLQGNVVDKNDDESLYNIFTKNLDETKNELFS